MKCLPEFAEVQRIAATGQYDVLPVSCELLSDFTTPIETMKILKNVSTHCYLLESALANEKSTDTGSNTNGGLYEDVYPGQMVTAFNDWCFDSARKSGDTGIVETTYGYHVIYYVGTTGQTYRDYQIVNDMEAWSQELLESYTVTMGDTSYMRKDIVLSN